MKFLLLLLTLLSLALCAEDFYKLLDIDRGASEKDIKRAYRRLSKKYHPDKNPDNEEAHAKFVSIAQAYEALSNAETRKIYDKYGHEGLERHKQGGGRGPQDPFDLFSRFFGGGGHFGGAGGVRRGPDMEVAVKVPLRDFYTGKEHEFQIEKQEICDTCEGSGSADGHVERCAQCGGHGVVMKKHMLAPGIFQNVQMACDRCGGKGQTIKNPCRACSGSRVVRRTSTLALEVERGMARGARVVYENEADASPDWEAGNLVVHVEEADAPADADAGVENDEERVDGRFFRRKGPDVFWKEVLSLREAWMGGWSRNLTHLDGHVVRLERARGAVVQPGAVEVLAGEGMPVHVVERERDPALPEFGRLIVEYAVVLPDLMDKGMEKDFWALWEKWRKKKGVDLQKEQGRPARSVKDEL